MMILSEHLTIYLKLIGSNGHVTMSVSINVTGISTISINLTGIFYVSTNDTGTTVSINVTGTLVRLH